MSKTLEQLKAQNKVIRWFDFRDGSILDKSGNGGACTIVGSPKWKMTKLGLGLFLDGSTSYLDLGNAVDLQISTGTAIVLFNTLGVKPGWNTLFSKASAYNLFAPTSSGYFGLYDFSVSIVRNTTATIRPGLHCAASAFNGNASRVFLDGSPQGILAQAFTSQASRLLLGFDSGSSNGLYGEVLAFVLVSENLTDSTVSAIYNEIMTERGAGSPKTSNFHALIPADTTGKCILHWDMYTKTGDGKMADRSGNGRAGTISQAQKAFKAPFDCLQFNGVLGSNVTLANGYTDTISGNQNAALSVWVNTDDLTSLPIVVTNSTGTFNIELNSGIIYVQLGASRTYTVTGLGNGKWFHLYFEKTGSGDAGNLYINNVLQSSYTGTIGDMPTVAASLIRIGAYYGGASYHMTGKIADFRLFSSNLTTAERTALYNDGAKRLVLNLPMGNETNVTLADVTSGLVSNTPWECVSGTWSVVQDTTSPYKKWLKCVSNGIVGIKSTKAYGTWVFDVYHADNSATDIMFIASDMAARNGATQSAYTLNLIPSERVQLEKNTPGTSTDLAYTAPYYFAAETAYRFVITRKYNGQFSVYIKGGAFTNWTLVSLAGGGGANPSTDNEITTSKYIVLNFAAGDKFSNLQILEGVIDPTANPELIPN